MIIIRIKESGLEFRYIGDIFIYLADNAIVIQGRHELGNFWDSIVFDMYWLDDIESITGH